MAVLFAETEPVLLLFSTQIMLGALAAEPRDDAASVERQGRFFVMFGLLQVWSIVAGFTVGSVLDAVVLRTCMALVTSRSRQLHAAGLAVVAITSVLGALLETST